MKLATVLPSLLLISVSGLLIACSTREEPEKAQVPESKGLELSAGARELLALLPEDNAIPGWTRNGEVRFFTPGNLWEYIDGAAEGYLTYGFQDVVTAEYTNSAKSSQAVIDIYRMKDARNAFGIYTAELNPESEFKRLGVEGYLGGTALNFWSGPYYVKITVFQESEDLKGEMVKLAERLSRKLGDPGSEPAEVKYFARENQIPHSVRYLPKDVLGQSYLEEAFEARYRQGNTESKVVVASFRDSEQARAALAKYRQFIASSGEVQQDLNSPADGGFAGKDSFYGHMAAVRSGSRIVIALGGPSADFALSRVKAAVPNVR
jgi:hypothetical protein